MTIQVRTYIMATSYGTDLKFNDDFSDLDSSLSITDDDYVVIQNIVTRLSSDEGSLWYDIDFGYNVFNLIGYPVDVNLGISTIKSRIQNECMKDERVLSAIVSIDEYILSTETLNISIEIKLKSGIEFDLVFNLTDESVDVSKKGI